MDAAIIEVVREVCRSRGVGELADDVASLVRPCVKLVTSLADEEDIPVGVTRMGGSPDVPRGFRWPSYGDEPSMFIGQINLTEVRRVLGDDLGPGTGLLSFFFDASGDALGTEDPRAVAVYRFDDADLRRRPPNEDLNDGELQSCSIEMFAFPSLPHLNYQGSLFELIIPGSMDHDTFDALEDFPYQLSEALLPTPTGEDRHQFLGYPLNCQRWDHFIRAEFRHGPAEIRSLTGTARADAIQAAARWSLIAQFDNDKHLPLRWVDSGVLSLLAAPDSDPLAPPRHPLWILDFM